MADLVITTARKPSEDNLARARYWARLLQAPVVERRGRSLPVLCQEENVRGALVIQVQRETYYEPAAGVELFFHPNLASVRIRNINEGSPDHMVAAMELATGDRVLDCTMGRGADAIICTHVVGHTGHVVAIEKVPVIAHLTIEGLRNSHYVSDAFTALMRRVDARCADYNQFLPTCEDAAFDVVYFDPIFHDPVEKSQSMAPVRAVGESAGLTVEASRQALRVARRAVVIKQRRGTGLWDMLGVQETLRGAQSRVEYGVLRPG